MAAVPFMAPWAAPLAAPTASADMVFLAPPEMGGLPYLAPLQVVLALPAPVLASGALAYLAPPLMDERPFLAPQLVPVTLVLQESSTGGRSRTIRRASVASKSSPAPAEVPYHSRSYEQDERAAIELDDEETTLAFLMELALS